MDVRCDRCQTEYELEDDSVAETGASVQCTTCGHTFVVSRRKADLTPTPGPTTEMTAAPAWVLTTEEGKTHRFRDPTTLQKWIVERRVGRNDRVAPPGASTRRLGDMDELRPFFDLVDQADRASASRVARPTQPETPQRLAGARGYATPDEDDDDALMGGRRSRGGSQRGRGGYSGRLDSDIAAGLSTMGVDDSIGVVVPERKLGKYLARGLVLAALAVGAWFLGSKSGASKNVATAPAPSPAPVAVPAMPPPATPPAAPPTPHVAAAPATPAPSPAAPPAAAKTQPPEDVPPEPLPPARQSARAGGSSADTPVRGRSYEQLVAEADRALEHGNTAKAQKAIDEALRLQPSGVAAVTSNGYLLLDKQKPLAAVGEFKRALNLAPNFPNALFGLGEAYRSAGNSAQAIDAYKRYLAAAPTGPDAPAAQRQIRDLESQPARPAHSATATVPSGAGTPAPPMPEPVPPP
jgi:predicted Zn finger-like uncharacterized protein